MTHEHHLAIQRSARYYTLGSENTAVQEVWFLLHGYGQLAGEFLRFFADLDDGSRLLVAPEALNRFYLVGPETAPAADRPVGATWMTREDRDREIADYVAYLERLHAVVLESLTPPPARVVALGFSQGAATASRWVARGSAAVDALVLWGGLLPPELGLAEPGWLRDVPLTIVVGNTDRYITPPTLDAQEQTLRANGVPHTLQRFEGGHAIKRSALGALAQSLSASGGSGR